MIYTVARQLVLAVQATAGAIRDRARHQPQAQAGSTLEMVIIILGLMTAAAALVAVLTHAVQSRVAQIH
jgi:hypothetical protein